MENKHLIDKAIGFIQENPKNNLSLQSIADHAGFSLGYFDAIFRQHTGYRPMEYARIYKLTRSALELRRTQKTVLEIALDYGYTSPESFARAFRNFYGISPSEYRQKHTGRAVTWHDLSGKIAISHFRRTFPEFKLSDIDLALDFCFTHNPRKYAEDIIGMTVAESVILTLGDPGSPEHFLYVSDYNSAEPAVSLVCEREKDALQYLQLLAKLQTPNFSVRKSVGDLWEHFDAEAAHMGLVCRHGYDMLFANDSVGIPEYADYSVRLLTAEDMPSIRMFKQNGSCAECHVKAIEIRLEGKGNLGLTPMGVFAKGELICMAMPVLDQVRELKKYDIGAIFTAKAPDENRVHELIWNYAINHCIRENAMLGNANAVEDDSPLGVSVCERLGLVKVAVTCKYRK
ncbi:MAG: helix-turn-helix transcriptional regulator [Clostridia bacterium]|nr:helix-turn-helix transcriptional regulator [Clostridia bacterium]